MIFLLICFSSFHNILFAERVIVYCDDNYPPYAYLEEGEVEGIYTEIFKLVFSRMEGYEIEIRAVPWKRGLSMLEKGQAFALYPPYYRPLTRPYMDYSIEILAEKLVVFGREEIMKNRNRNKWPEDYYGLSVGKNAGFALPGDEFTRAVQNGDIRVVEAYSNRANILKLGAGRIDVYVNDRLSILWEMKRLINSGEYDEGGRHSVIIEGPTISYENGYLGITNAKPFSYKQDFLEQFNRIISEMKENGEIDKIIENYIK